VFPFPPRDWGDWLGRAWHHPGHWMAQFWLKPKGTFDDSLRCRVNARQVYWMSPSTIPGGIALENFELRESFKPGREIWFGLSTESPSRQFGFRYDACPAAEPREVAVEEAEQIKAATKGNAPLTNGDFSAGLTGWRCDAGAKEFQVLDLDKHKTLRTYGPRKEANMGRVYQCFKVPSEASELRFYLAGGCDRERLYVALWDGKRLWRRMTGGGGDRFFEVHWDAKPLRGRTVTLEIVDRAKDPGGHLAVQAFAIRGEGKK
jgi:hypothetical protein